MAGGLIRHSSLSCTLCDQSLTPGVESSLGGAVVMADVRTLVKVAMFVLLLWVILVSRAVGSRGLVVQRLPEIPSNVVL